MSAWMVEVAIDGSKTVTFGPKSGCGMPPPPPPPPPVGSAHCWLELSAQSQIWAWVPEPPKPVSSRHLPELGFSSSPLDCGTQT